MRKTYLVAAVVCCALLAIDTMVLVTPVLAATCEVECADGGPTLTCTGDTCEVSETGCKAWEGGFLSEVKNCPIEE